MKVLAIESSGMVASIAIVEDDNLLGEYTMNYKKTHSQTLLPMLQTLAEMIELDLDSIDAIAVSGGPGSFTGLRIGSATAKGLGLALKKPIVHVPTLDALAYNLWGTDRMICPLMDARRQQVYTGLYAFVDDKLENLLPQCIIDVHEIIAQINEKGRSVIFLGDGVDAFREILAEECKVPYCFAPAHKNKQSGASVAALGLALYTEGKYETAAEHKPDYLRPSQAERESHGVAKDFTV